jgi:hypothetical protein
MPKERYRSESTTLPSGAISKLSALVELNSVLTRVQDARARHP